MKTKAMRTTVADFYDFGNIVCRKQRSYPQISISFSSLPIVSVEGAGQQ
jgi:hypothetical protein